MRRQNKKGSVLTEYGILAAVISVAAIGTISTMGESINDLIAKVNSKLAQQSTSVPPPAENQPPGDTESEPATFVVKPGISTIQLVVGYPIAYNGIPGIDPAKHTTVTIDWGDGETSVYDYANADITQLASMLITKTYTANAPHTVKVYGNLQSLGIGTDNQVQEVVTWGDYEISHLLSLMGGDTYIPPTLRLPTGVKALTQAFRGRDFAANPIPQLSSLDTTGVTSMAGIFGRTKNLDADLNGWDVSSVQSLAAAFEAAENIDAKVDQWNTSSVIDLRQTFYQASGDIDPDNWNTANVLTMKGVAADSTLPNLDLNNWNTQRVTDFSSAFQGVNTTPLALGRLNTSNTTAMQNMFYLATGDIGDLSGWNTSMVTNMSGMFMTSQATVSGLNGWDVSKVTTLQQFAHQATLFNTDLSSWRLPSLTGAIQAFYAATSAAIDLSGWCTPLITAAPSNFATGGTPLTGTPVWGAACN